MAPFVYKVGGSLLTLPDLAERLEAALVLHRERRPLLIVGGGATADLVRHWDTLHGLGEERSHALALSAMSLNERFVEALLPRARIVRTREEAGVAWQDRRVPILCSREFLQDEEGALAAGRGNPDLPGVLPHTWEVTSDSIAAWVALRWPAAGLVLLKSRGTRCPNDDAGARGDDSRAGDSPAGTAPVDAYFSTLAAALPRIEWINLRAASLTVESWSPAEIAEATQAAQALDEG